jgi:hypothetical protein
MMSILKSFGLRRAILVFPVALAMGACCNPPAEESLGVTLRAQETSMWCWAASGQMVMDSNPRRLCRRRLARV